ncbi:MAG: lysophospholipid acyltransferase family protein [Bacteroidetes bacterium]|nr:lysophospholipid acyltransferase family protein [Bacteroidota bacterium]
MLFDLISPAFSGMSAVERLATGQRIGQFIYHLFPYRRKVIRKNLENYFRFFDLDSSVSEEIIRKNYEHMGCLFVENFWMKGVRPDQLTGSVTIDNPDGESWKYLQSRQPAILALGHIGNWEFIVSTIRHLTGHPVYFISKKIKSRSVNRFMHQLRQQSGNRMIMPEQAREILYPELERGESLGLAADQSAPTDSYWDFFLGKPVPVFLGPATFSIRYRIPIIFLAPIRNEDGTFTIYHEFIQSEDLFDKPSPQNRYQLTRRYLAMVEKYIGLFPDQYYWIHKRWKHTHLASDFMPKYHPERKDF